MRSFAIKRPTAATPIAHTRSGPRTGRQRIPGGGFKNSNRKPLTLLIVALSASVISCERDTGRLLAPARVPAPNADVDRETLSRIYEATSGDSWTVNSNWLSDKPISEWYGVTADSEGRVGVLSLTNNNLAGPLPAALADLDSLLVLNLSNNNLTGTIPSALGSLPRLRDLLLQGNSLSGPLPATLGDLSALTFLSLLQNPGLTGPLPDSFRNLSLRVFLTSDTALCIPVDLISWYNAIPHRDFFRTCQSNLADREALVGLYHDMNGPAWINRANWLSETPISAWFGVTVNNEGRVIELTLNYNELTGLLSSHLWSLTELTNLELYGNNITGSISSRIGELSKLTNVELDGNSLSGNLPVELFTLSQLTNLEIERNELRGELPSHIQQLKHLTSLEAYSNRFTGALPPELGQLTQLTNLRLDDNNFTGSLPQEFANLKQLRTLYLSQNRLSGPLPSFLGDLSSLEQLWLHQNQFTTPTPALGRLKRLQVLYLAQNHLRGRIPDEWGDMVSLIQLDAGRNDLYGPIPATFGNLEALEGLNLYSNALSGSIPPELGNLERLRTLNLPYNNLSGPIPGDLARVGSATVSPAAEVRVPATSPAAGPVTRPRYAGLQGLVRLDLAYNNLSGSLPPELGALGSLAYVFLNGNSELSGIVPTTYAELAGLVGFGIDGTKLCLGLDDDSLKLYAQMTFVRPRLCSPAEYDRLLLEDIFDELRGVGWTAATNWTSNAPLSSWHGVRLDGLNRVAELKLDSMNLRGPLPSTFGHFQGLRTLSLRGNHLSGSVPATFGNLRTLKVLDLSSNAALTGPLPLTMTDVPLARLDIGDTGLCLVDRSGVTAWVSEMEALRAEHCASVGSPFLRIPGVLATQAVQTPENDVPIVASNDLWLRVFVTNREAGHYAPVLVIATVSVAGTVEWSDSTRVRALELPTDTNWRFSDDATVIRVPGEVVVPGMTIVVEAQSQDARARGNARYVLDELDVVRTRPYDLTIVPILQVEDSDPAVIQWALNNDELIGRKVSSFFGASGTTAKVRAPFVTTVPLGTSDGPFRVLSELKVARLIDGDDTIWYGVGESQRGFFRGRSEFFGAVAVGKPIVAEVVHELGHLLGLRHAPCGGAPFFDESFPYANGSIGGWGFQPETGEVGDPAIVRDVMGYCYGRGWISDYNFRKTIQIFRSPVPGGVDEVGGGARDEGQPVKPGSESDESLIVWGVVVDGEIRLEPPFVVNAEGGSEEVKGDYLVEVRDGEGAPLVKKAFETHEDKFGTKYFAVRVAKGGPTVEMIVVSGPEGQAAIGIESAGPVTVVRGLETGTVRALVRGLPGRGLLESLSLDGDGEGLEVVASSGRGVVRRWQAPGGPGS